MSSQNQAEKPNYFNTIATGLGYLNPPRTVEPKEGKPYQVVRLSVLQGSVDDPVYATFELKVVGQALDAIAVLEGALNAEDTPVLVGFTASDVYAQGFAFSSGKRKGEIGSVVKGRLIKIKWAKVNGAHVELPGQDEADREGGQPSAVPTQEPMRQQRRQAARRR